MVLNFMFTLYLIKLLFLRVGIYTRFTPTLLKKSLKNLFTVLFSDTVRLAIRKITYAPERPLPKVSVVGSANKSINLYFK